MAIQDDMLVNVSKALNSETYAIPAYLTVATTVVTSIDTDATVLEGEIGTRIAFTGSRQTKQLTISAIRSGAIVIDTINGDTLYTSGGSATLAGSDLQLGVIHAGITQTTNFDLEFNYVIDAVRRGE